MRGRTTREYAYYKASVEVGKAEEYLDIVLRLGNRPIDNGVNAFWIHCDAVGGNDKTKELGFLDMKFALLEFDIKLLIEEALKNLSDMLYMFFESAVGVNKDIIQIGDTEVVEEFAEGVVDVRLEDCWSVAETEGHNQIFEVTIPGTKGCFLFIAFSNTHSMKGVTNI